MRRIPSRFSNVTPHLLTTLVFLSAVGTPALAAPRQSVDAPPAVQAAPDPLIVVVSLRKQRLTVFDKNGPVTDSPVSSGQPDFPTPTGIFSVIGKAVEHESNIYEGAQMPYMQRLTWTGTAMHAGNLPGYPASHGCIRLPYNFSKRLFEMTQINTRVIVTRDEVAPMPISHPSLFVPAVEAQPEDQRMVQAVTSKIASIEATPPMQAPMAVTGSGQLPLTAKAKARFAETSKLFEAIKPAEAARAAVWDNVKAANRALEEARADINSLQNTIDDAQDEANKFRKAKVAAEAQLGAVMRKAQNARSSAAIEAAAKAEDAAETRLLDAVGRHDAALDAVAVLKSGMAGLVSKRQTAEANRRALDDELKRSNQALKNAQGAYGLAKREDNRYAKPVSVFVSRKDQRLYVRQGFDPVLEVPVIIEQADQPLGTHVFTAMSVKGGWSLQWSVVTLSGETGDEDRRGKKKSGAAKPTAAAKALDRIAFPPDALAAIADVVKPGSSLIVSDDSTSQYFGNGTDFTVASK
ncbi:MAG: L,D-transpeptidase family protein [Hyphomicrobiaceae bacterium]